MENSLVHREGTKITYSVYRNFLQGGFSYSVYKGIKLGDYDTEGLALAALRKDSGATGKLESTIKIYQRLLKTALAVILGLVIAFLIDRVQG